MEYHLAPFLSCLPIAIHPQPNGGYTVSEMLPGADGEFRCIGAFSNAQHMMSALISAFGPGEENHPEESYAP